MDEIKNRLNLESLSKRVRVIIETKTVISSSRTEHLLKTNIKWRLRDDEKI